jgi:hypothetical protein
MNQHFMQKIALLVTGVALVGLLSGCGGSTSAAATTDNGAAASNGSGQHNKGNKGGANMQQRLQDAGASADEAKALMQLVRDNHVQAKWVIDQLTNKVPVSTITDDIKNGKAPKITQSNGNWKGKKSGSGTGSGSNSSTGSNSGNSSAGNSSSSSSNGSSN